MAEPTRRTARRIMLTIRQHDARRRRNYGDAPHPERWGCNERCIPTGTPEALDLAIQVGGIVVIHDPDEGDLYVPGWMKPA